MAGTIVYLNGPSSCGKHTIIDAIRQRSNRSWVNIGLHDWFAQVLALPADASPFITADDDRLVRIRPRDTAGRQLLRDRYAQAAALAEQGDNVLVDDSMDEPWMVTECARTL